ncbi:epoxide hydrolase A [Deinococcus carri]|uniref:Epoxide hydrolase A n=1 Tax=Deinococcus carri TaxID=1211323 RepID=A0ABP9W6U1_9DEIO
MTLRTRQLHRGGLDLHLVEAGSGPLVLLLHGYPETSYSWRHQLPVLAGAGMHAVAPDLRGVGHSDAPSHEGGYGMPHLIADVIGIIDGLGAANAVLVGHDWGAQLAWQVAECHPARVRGIVALSVPYAPLAAPTPAQVVMRPAKFFEDYFALVAGDEPRLREALRRFFVALSGDAPPHTLDVLFDAPNGPDTQTLRDLPLDPALSRRWLTDEDLDHYTREFMYSGFAGVFGRYRSLLRDFTQAPGTRGRGLGHPATFLGGTQDSAVRFANLDQMRALLPNLQELTLLRGCGHWVQQERPDAVNAAILDLLAQV